MWNDQLACFVKSISYDYDAKRGRLNMEERNCCDMSGCIDLFTRIDPDVNRIHTYTGNTPDTYYIHKRGEWTAHLKRQV